MIIVDDRPSNGAELKNIIRRKEKMNITDLRVRLINRDDTKLKAVASITIDDAFVVHDIKVIEGNDGYFIAMPSRKNADGEYRDVAHPINAAVREQLISKILEAYKLELEKQEAEAF